MVKTFWQGKAITSEFAKYLEDNGIANVGEASGGGTAPDGTTGEPWIRMDPGPGNKWLEKQPPEVFLRHVFGHTCTWEEMARRWADDGEEGMFIIAEMLKSLNYWLLQVPKERKEREAS